MLVFRQLFDPQSSTYTYLLGDRPSDQAVLIDPVFEQVRRDVALVGELGLKLVATLETHVHADHVTGAWLLKQRTGSRVMVAKASGAAGADRYLSQDDVVAFGGRRLMVRATPGHTNSCLTYVLDDRGVAFTGDCLMIRGAGRTDFQGGDAAAMYRSIHEQIFTLPDDCLLYPSHDYRGLTVTSVGEERRFNPRIGGEIGVGDFTGYMKNLGLAHPKLMDIAVPANLRCGRPEIDAAAESTAPADPGWATLRYSFARRDAALARRRPPGRGRQRLAAALAPYSGAGARSIASGIISALGGAEPLSTRSCRASVSIGFSSGNGSCVPSTSISLNLRA